MTEYGKSTLPDDYSIYFKQFGYSNALFVMFSCCKVRMAFLVHHILNRNESQGLTVACNCGTPWTFLLTCLLYRKEKLNHLIEGFLLMTLSTKKENRWWRFPTFSNSVSMEEWCSIADTHNIIELNTLIVVVYVPLNIRESYIMIFRKVNLNNNHLSLSHSSRILTILSEFKFRHKLGWSVTTCDQYSEYYMQGRAAKVLDCNSTG